MTATALDRDRLLRDLRAAAEEAEAPMTGGLEADELTTWAMARAWRVIAAAIEDGEYDQFPPSEHAQGRAINFIRRHNPYTKEEDT